MMTVVIVPFFLSLKIEVCCRYVTEKKLRCFKVCLVQAFILLNYEALQVANSPHLHHGHQLLELPEFLLRRLLMSLLDETAVVPQAASSAGLGNFTVGGAGPRSSIIVKTVFVLVVHLCHVERGVPIVLTFYRKGEVHASFEYHTVL